MYFGKCYFPREIFVCLLGKLRSTKPKKTKNNFVHFGSDKILSYF